jgi:hypothetical protein
VTGLVISGFIISQKAYTESFGKGSFKATVLKLKESGQLDFLDDEAESSEPGKYEYVHLKNAKIYAPGQHPFPADEMLWRGRISSIDVTRTACSALESRIRKASPWKYGLKIYSTSASDATAAARLMKNILRVVV